MPHTLPQGVLALHPELMPSVRAGLAMHATVPALAHKCCQGRSFFAALHWPPGDPNAQFLPQNHYLCAMLVLDITTALMAVADPEFQVRQQGYSKEPIRSLGVRVGTMRAIAKSFFPVVKSLPMPEFLAACWQLLREGTVEHTGRA